MTEVSKQLLIDYAAGRPLKLMTRDLGCHENTLTRRILDAIAEIDAIPEYRRVDVVGNETMAAYWKIKYMRQVSVHQRKRVRASARWSKVVSARQHCHREEQSA